MNNNSALINLVLDIVSSNMRRSVEESIETQEDGSDPDILETVNEEDDSEYEVGEPSIPIPPISSSRYSYREDNDRDNFLGETLLVGMQHIFNMQRNNIINEMEEAYLQEALRHSEIEYQRYAYESKSENMIDLPFSLYNDIDIDNKQEACTICLEDFEKESEVSILHCKHIFHKECIKEWVSRKNICPNCKTTIN